jgi:hypothetical protein
LVDFGSLSDHNRSSSFEGRELGGVDGVALAVVGDGDVTDDGKDHIWCRHLHDEVGVMRYGHELGQHRSTKDGVVGAEVRDLERQVLCAEVLLCVEGDEQEYMTYGVCSLTEHNTIDRLIAGGHLGEVEVHLSQRFYEDDVQVVAPSMRVLERNAPSTMGLTTIG